MYIVPRWMRAAFAKLDINLKRNTKNAGTKHEEISKDEARPILIAVIVHKVHPRSPERVQCQVPVVDDLLLVIISDGVK